MPSFLRLLALPLLAVSFGASAQTDFRPGYIVQPAGDTVRGEVDNRSALRNATQCRFRQGGAVREYAPAELLAYGLSGAKVYHSRPVTVPDSAAQPARPYFLEVLVAGAANLYSRRDADGKDHFYISTSEAATTELVQRRKLVQTNNSSEVKVSIRYQEKNLFRGTLAEAFASCPSVQQRVSDLGFTQSALTAVIKRYNTCVSGTATNEKQISVSRLPRLTLGIVGGINRSQLKITGYTSYNDARFPNATQLVGGLRLGLTLPRLSEKLSVQIEALYQQQEFQAEYVTSFGSSIPYKEQGRVELTYLRIPIMLRYTYPIGRIRPIAQLGISTNFGLEAVPIIRQQSSYNAGSEYGTWKAPLDPGAVSRFDPGVVGSLGAQLQALGGRLITMEARTEKSSGFINSVGIKDTMWHHYVLLGVNLTK
ncbi:PorT family protein [Hymenobacter sp. BT635]|uniref:PorT family protein n=1 Tax=Hymenobacter nitidus TaxID=2880929 RepID=A0ABS8ACW1_9BACT|nr:porin family protein [Hymenobacter nitidus]MCB2378136.1 PorT family protein [Hymenobacter nitidus]